MKRIDALLRRCHKCRQRKVLHARGFCRACYWKLRDAGWLPPKIPYTAWLDEQMLDAIGRAWRQSGRKRPTVFDVPAGLRAAAADRFGGWYGVLIRLGLWPTLEQVKALRKEGLSIGKIAQRYVMTPQAVWTMLKKASPRLKRMLYRPPKGPASPFYVGRFKSRGYVLLRHPQTGARIAEHRYVVEQQLGRPLKSSEIVHHLNGIKDDNRRENLTVLDSHRKHAYETRSFIVALQGRIRELETQRH